MSATTLQPLSLITSLMKPELYDHAVKKCVLFETHISWVIVAEPYAYKIKKSVNLGFLDFSTLEKRHFYCNEELRLNKRLASSIYLSVVPITGTYEHPQWAGEGEVIEYAVRMLAFPQQAQLDRVLGRGALQQEQIDILARHIADFHHQTDVADIDSIYGDPKCVFQPVEENFKQIYAHVSNEKVLGTLAELKQWSLATFQQLHSIFVQRKADGCIRECHGDMHLRNIAWVEEGPIVFDCIEFSPSLRWIDVMSDVAFLVMDLQDRKYPELAQRFLNNYLQHTGDYAGLRVLRFYQVYRALVRAKIDAIRAQQVGISKEEQDEAEQDFFDYLKLALDYIQPVKQQLIITRGLSASGKSTVTQLLLEQAGAIRVRSDVERKLLFGLQPENGGHSAVESGIYTRDATRRTYGKLLERAAQIIDAGYSVIVDAVFLHHEERDQFRKLADTKQAAYIILECTADAETLRQRIVRRKNDVSDADLKVLEMQRVRWQPLLPDECINTVTVDTGKPYDINFLAAEINEKSCV
ncbi:MAG: AAA family ATPase [Desulforhopalus sp.]